MKCTWGKMAIMLLSEDSPGHVAWDLFAIQGSVLRAGGGARVAGLQAETRQTHLLLRAAVSAAID